MNALPVDHTPAVGAATGPAIVFLHGFTGSTATDWPAERWAKPLAAAGRETLVIHLPGHGSGPAAASADEVTTAQVLHRLAETVRTATTDEIDLVGYSLGARLAWDLAAVSLVPVRKLVLGALSPMDPFTMVDLAAARAFVADGTPPADPITGVIAGMCTAPGQDAGSLLNLVEGMAREPFNPATRPPAVPTLFLAGDADPMAHGIDALVAQVPGARLSRVPGDHVGALSGTQFQAAVFDFLGVAQA